jgi:hypothetical protein
MTNIWNFSLDWVKIKNNSSKGFFNSLFRSSNRRIQDKGNNFDLDLYLCMKLRDTSEREVIHFANHGNYSFNHSGILNFRSYCSKDDLYDYRYNEAITIDLDELKLVYSSIVLGVYSFYRYEFDNIAYINLKINDNIHNINNIVGNFHIDNKSSLEGSNHLILGVIDLNFIEFKTLGITLDNESFTDATDKAFKYCI